MGASMTTVKTRLTTRPRMFSGTAICRPVNVDTIHTWPAKGYAAVDVFLCGKADPQVALSVLVKCLKPKSVQVYELKSGFSDSGKQAGSALRNLDPRVARTWISK